MTESDFLLSAKRTIQLEAQAVSDLIAHLDDHFHQACTLILNCQGRVIVTGMGKSGHIGNKIAATLASTGTPAFYVHPGEASHGDLGMITAKDVVIALSNSGETAEVLTLIPLLKRMQAPLISITANPNSNLSKQADANLHIAVEKEACPLGLAPTSSTTAQLVMGDALAIALLEKRGFNRDDFAFSHPGGSLGRRLLLKVQDIMHTGEDIPCVASGSSLREALLEMTQKRLGMTAIVNDQKQLQGVFTDGDLRRALDQNISPQDILVDQVMTCNCTRVKQNLLAAECLQIMEDKKINALIVTNDAEQPVGALNMHDLLKAGVL